MIFAYRMGIRMPGMVVLAYIGIPSEYGWPVVLYWYLCARGTSVAVTYALEKTKPRVRARERETKYEIILRADSTMLERIGYRIQHNEVVLLLFLFSSTHIFFLLLLLVGTHRVDCAAAAAAAAGAGAALCRLQVYL